MLKNMPKFMTPEIIGMLMNKGHSDEIAPLKNKRPYSFSPVLWFIYFFIFPIYCRIPKSLFISLISRLVGIEVCVPGLVTDNAAILFPYCADFRMSWLLE